MRNTPFIYKMRHMSKRQREMATNFTSSVCLSIRKDSYILKKFFRLLRLFYATADQKSWSIPVAGLEKSLVPTSLPSILFDRVDQGCTLYPEFVSPFFLLLTSLPQVIVIVLVPQPWGEMLLLSCTKSNHIFSLVSCWLASPYQADYGQLHKHQHWHKREWGKSWPRTT